MLGKLLDRRYQVSQVLGAGGFGKTYIAQDTRRPGNPICVVKQLQPLSTDPSFLEAARRMFNSEAETLEQLGNHDQIPRLLAYFEEDQEFYLVQEFIEGHTLTQELQLGQKWEENRVIELLEEILSILEFVHKHNVIHRDIKPDNIIRRNSDNKLVLVDFGAVKQIRTQFATAYGTPNNTIAVGTPGYMASEQARGQPRPSSDIYSLGNIAIQALTGLSPIQFQEDVNTGEILWEHLVPVSRELANVVTTMVKYHFKDRYQSATEALQALRQLNAPYSPPQYPPARETLPRQTYPNPSENLTLPVSPAARPLPPPRKAVPSSVPSEPASSSGAATLLIGIGMVLAVGAGIAFALRQNSFGPGIIGSNNQKNCVVVANPGLNVRSQPEVRDDNVVQSLSTDTNITLTGAKQGSWVEIRTPTRGWVSSNLIDCNSNIATDTPAVVKPTPTPVVTPKVKVVPTVSVPPSPSPSPSASPVKPKPPVDDSSKTLEKANEKYQQGDLPGAIAEARKLIQEGAAAKDEAIAKIKQWKQEWDDAQAKYNQIKKALDEGKFDQVLIQEADKAFPEQRYWRDQLNQLIEEAKKRKAEAEANIKNPTPPVETPNSKKPTPQTTQPGKPSASPVSR